MSKSNAKVSFDSKQGMQQELSEQELANVKGATQGAQPRQYGGLRIRSMGSAAYEIWSAK